MKHILHTKALVGLMILMAGAIVASCQKDPLDEFNPKTETIAEAPFSLKGTEKRSDGGYVLTWDITKTTVDCVQEELDELAITPFNTFTFEAVPESASATFPGINARTDNACIKLERKGQSSFSISYVSDGDATIKVWNGNEGGNTAVTFKVQARKTIPVEGLLVRIDGEEEALIKVAGPTWADYIQQRRDYPFCTVKYLPDDKIKYPIEDMWEAFSYYDREDLNLRKLEILHIQPENTTFRRLNGSYADCGYPGMVSYLFCEGEFDWYDIVKEGKRYNFPSGADISVIYGKSIFFCSSPGGKPGLVAMDYCPPGQFSLMETKHNDPNDVVRGTEEVWTLVTAVKVVD